MVPLWSRKGIDKMDKSNDLYLLFYKNEIDNVTCISEWLDKEMDNFLSSDDGLSLDQISTLVYALNLYQKSCIKCFKDWEA